MKVHLGNAKGGRGRLRELLITKFMSQIKRRFKKVVVTRADLLRAWLQGELRLYYLLCHATCQGSPDVALGQTCVEIYAHGYKMDMNKGLSFLLKVVKQYNLRLFRQLFGL